MTIRFTLSPFELFTLSTRLRIPFRYGIASMTEVPQLFVRTTVTANGRSEPGLAAEGLPPKWFTKDPATTFEQDLPEMLQVIGYAVTAAAAARSPISFFDLWREVERQQSVWAASRGIAPLLAHLGVSLVERAVLEGLCRIAGEPLHRTLAGDALGLRLGDVYAELHDVHLRAVVRARPLESCFVRHTLGLSDALTAADIPPEDRVDDGLPQDLEASIRAYGLRYFKVKLSGTLDRDVPRLSRLLDILQREVGDDWWVTLDGNEFFHDVHAFRSYWDTANAEAALARLWPRVVVVEQPIHRSRALTPEAGLALREWTTRPPMIVDESDGALGDVPTALASGYIGASHKNCKGIVKGLANAAVLGQRRRAGQRVELTGEDLCILGPVALLQDLAMMSLLGIGHVERNGHHYYRGLSLLPAAWQEQTLASHGDAYTRHPDGFARLDIVDGRVRLGSVNRAPFGVEPALDPSGFQRVES